jgi:hypothetical protein
MAKRRKVGQPLTKASDKKKGRKKTSAATGELPVKIVGVDVLAARAAREETLLYDPHLYKRRKIRGGITDMDIEHALKRCRRDWEHDRFHVTKKIWQYSLIGPNVDGNDICIGVEVHKNILVVTAYRIS